MPFVLFFLACLYVMILWAILAASFSLAIGAIYGIVYLLSLLPLQWQTNIVEFLTPITNDIGSFSDSIVGYITSIGLVQQYSNEFLLAFALLLCYATKRKFAHEKIMLFLYEDSFFKKYKKLLIAYFAVFGVMGMGLMPVIGAMDNLLYQIIAGFYGIGVLFLFIKNFMLIAGSVYVDIKDLIYMAIYRINLCVMHTKAWLYRLLRSAWRWLIGRIKH